MGIVSIIQGRVAMKHFAYPNAAAFDDSSFEFIGCGRFSVFKTNQQPDGYHKAEPNTMSCNNVIKIVSQDPFFKSITDNDIYEIKDQDFPYIGCSLDLALYLSYIYKYRDLKPDFFRLKGDIWATGEIGENGLQPVEQKQFEEKLKAFLSDNNKDLIFICPAGNFAENLKVFVNDSKPIIANVLNLKQKISHISENKLILLVNENELPDLNNLLFVRNPHKTGLLSFFLDNKKRITAFLLLCIVLFAIIISLLPFKQKKTNSGPISYEHIWIKTAEDEYVSMDQCSYDSPCNITRGKSHVYVKIKPEGYAAAFLKDKDYFYNQEGRLFIHKSIEGKIDLWPGTSDYRAPQRLFKLYIVISNKKIDITSDSKKLTMLPQGKSIGPAFLKPRPEWWRSAKKPVVKNEWIYFYPREFNGDVWITVKPKNKIPGKKYDYSLRFGPWVKKGQFEISQGNGLSLTFKKKKDTHSIPVFFKITPACNVSFGQGVKTDVETIDINQGWVDLEG